MEMEMENGNICNNHHNYYQLLIIIFQNSKVLSISKLTVFRFESVGQNSMNRLPAGALRIYDWHFSVFSDIP